MNQKTLHEQLKKIQEKNLLKYEKALKRTYLNAYDDIMKEIAYLDKKDTLKVSELVRKNRFMNLKEQISKVLNALGEKEIVDGIETSLTDGYYGLAYELSKSSNKDIMWGLLNTNTVQVAVWHSDLTINIIKTFKADWEKKIPKNLKESFLKQIFNKNNFAQKAAVWNALNQSLITGASYQNTARSVKDAFEKGYNQALRVMRTEGHKAQMIGELTSSQYAIKQGVDLQEFWIATIDLRTRPSHKAMDNKFKNEDGVFVLPNGVRTEAPGITGITEEDIHCRCSIGYVVDGIAPDQRRIGVANVEKDYEQFIYELKYKDFPKGLEYFDSIFELSSLKKHYKSLYKNGDNALDIFKKYLSKYAKQAAYSEEQHNKIYEHFKNNVYNLPITIRITQNNLEKVFNSGRFKSVFETGFSGGAGDLNLRKSVEKEMFGIPKKIDKKLRPIYGTLGDFKEYFNTHYGNVSVRLKQSVKKRSTWVMGDSLDDSIAFQDSDSEGSIFKINKFGELNKNDVLSFYTYAFNRKHPIKKIENTSDYAKHYIEVQVHGGVSVEDIEGIVFNTESEISLKIRYFAKRNNIKLFVRGDDYGNLREIRPFNTN